MTSEAEGFKHIAVKAVRHYSQLFRDKNNANVVRAMRLWKQGATYESDFGTISCRGSTSTITRNAALELKRVELKARPGRVRKRAQMIS